MNHLLLMDLESLIDKHTLEGVLSAAAEICGGKAEHVRVNWQDYHLAKDWSRLAARIEAAVVSAAKTNQPGIAQRPTHTSCSVII